jgi:hypothetical protein
MPVTLLSPRAGWDAQVVSCPIVAFECEQTVE